MKDNIRQAFDQVHADPALKARTRAFVAAQTQPRLARPARRLPQVLAAAACLLVLLAGSYWIYFFPTARISIDINPSIELSVNRFDRVVGVEGWNEDGQALAETLDIQFDTYTQAVEAILADQKIAALLAEGGVMDITVVAPQNDLHRRPSEHPLPHRPAPGAGGSPRPGPLLRQVPSLSGAVRPGPLHHPPAGGLHDHAGNPGPAGPAGKRRRQRGFFFLCRRRPGPRPPPWLRPPISTPSFAQPTGFPRRLLFCRVKTQEFLKEITRKAPGYIKVNSKRIWYSKIEHNREQNGGAICRKGGDAAACAFRPAAL